jgi:hypothetical protein
VSVKSRTLTPTYLRDHTSPGDEVNCDSHLKAEEQPQRLGAVANLHNSAGFRIDPSPADPNICALLP